MAKVKEAFNRVSCDARARTHRRPDARRTPRQAADHRGARRALPRTAAIVYLNAFGNEFVLDDTRIIRDNLRIRSLANVPGLLRIVVLGPGGHQCALPADGARQLRGELRDARRVDLRLHGSQHRPACGRLAPAVRARARHWRIVVRRHRGWARLRGSPGPHRGRHRDRGPAGAAGCVLRSPRDALSSARGRRGSDRQRLSGRNARLLCLRVAGEGERHDAPPGTAGNGPDRPCARRSAAAGGTPFPRRHATISRSLSWLLPILR